MAVGVGLVTKRGGTPVGCHVHMQTAEWCLTSSSCPPDDSILTASLLQDCLPGYLGAHVYPEDVVFSLRGLDQTTPADLTRTIQEEKARIHVSNQEALLTRMNHITFSEPIMAESAPDDDDLKEEEEDCVPEDEVESEYDSDQKADDLCWLEDELMDDEDEPAKPASK